MIYKYDIWYKKGHNFWNFPHQVKFFRIHLAKSFFVIFMISWKIYLYYIMPPPRQAGWLLSSSLCDFLPLRFGGFLPFSSLRSRALAPLLLPHDHPPHIGGPAQGLHGQQCAYVIAKYLSWRKIAFDEIVWGYFGEICFIFFKKKGEVKHNNSIVFLPMQYCVWFWLSVGCQLCLSRVVSLIPSLLL